MKVYEAIAEAIHKEGGDTIFGVMGNANMYLIGELCGQYGFKLVQAKHEQRATSRSDGYARVIGKTGRATRSHATWLINSNPPVVSVRRPQSKRLSRACGARTSVCGKISVCAGGRNFARKRDVFRLLALFGCKRWAWYRSGK